MNLSPLLFVSTNILGFDGLEGSRFLVTLIIMPPPTKRQINNLPRSSDTVKRLKGLQYNGTLLLHIPRFAERVTKRPLQIDAARRLHLFGEFTHD